jgi:hypothetical protein
MKSLVLLALLASSNAQYFSAGWSPGQKQPEHQSLKQPEPVPVAAEPVKATTPLSLLKLFDTTTILKSGPSVALFNRFGINITERMESASLAKIWDERVPLITDDNYEDLIVNEALTEQEEIDRVWIIAISVTSQRSDGVSKILDNVFDSAFNESQITGDLQHVRWGRMDYLNVTRITTKWAVWQAPYLVVLKDRGKTLRFYRPRNLRLQEDALLEFLKTDGWKATPPWSSSYAPGGSNEHILDFFAVWLTKIYNVTLLIPRWLLVFGSGTIASVLIGFLHKSPPDPPVATNSQSTVSATTTASIKSTDTPAQSDGAKRTGAKQRKSKA